MATVNHNGPAQRVSLDNKPLAYQRTVSNRYIPVVSNHIYAQVLKSDSCKSNRLLVMNLSLNNQFKYQ